MENLKWVKGMKSPNEEGSRRHHKATVHSLIDRLLKGVFTYKEFKKRSEKLSDAQFFEIGYRLMALKVPKPSADSLSQEEIESLYEKIESKVVNDALGKAKKTG